MPPLEVGNNLFLLVGAPPAGAAERERRADDRREAEPSLYLQRLLHRVGERGARRTEADLRHGLLELLTILGLVDRLARGTDHLDVEFLEHALARQVERAVERRLPAHRR